MNRTMLDLVALTHSYLRAFSAHDLAGLAALFADDVVLRDWEVGRVSGKAAVLAVNERLFAAAPTIEARVVSIHLAGRTTVAELEVLANGKLLVLVADIIDFDEAGRITAIRAYRGT